MKTLVIFLSISVFGLLSVQNAMAISGACSWHGGVNCAAGAGLNGQVICNDGWQNSSVNFYDMDECKSAPTCTLNDLSQLQSKYGIADKQNQINNLQTQINNLRLSALRDSQSGFGTGAPLAVAQAHQNAVMQQEQFQEVTLNIQLQSLAAQLSLARQNVQSECLALGVQERIQAQASAYQSAMQAQQQSMNNILQTACAARGGHLDGNNNCACGNGYVFYNIADKCITNTEACQITFGSNAISSNNPNNPTACSCGSGYHWNDNQTQCIAQTLPPPPVVTTAPTSDASTTGQVLAASSSTLFTITKNIGLGSAGDDVIALQEFLESEGFLVLPAGTTKGYFGQATKRALSAFQKSNGLLPTGYCGAATRSFINSQN